MSWLLNLFYGCVLILSAPWFAWRYFVQGKNRRGWSQKLFGNVPRRDSENQCIWFHAVSVGEVNLLAPVISELLTRRPELDVVISTSTETGFELARSKYRNIAQHVFFCPMDFTWAVNKVVERIRPAALVIAELELWPNLVRVVSSHGIPVSIINARLSEKSARGYHRIGFLTRSILNDLSWLGVQNDVYAGRFRELECSPDKIFVTGSVKFDGIESDRDNPRTRELALLSGLENKIVFLAGSTQLAGDQLSVKAYENLKEKIEGLQLVLAPRHPRRCAELVSWIEERGHKTRLRSRLGMDDASTCENTILIIDVIGELSAWWGVADVAFVGGSLGDRGGQNMIEPAAYGIPISFGPRTENFKEIVSQLLAQDAATVIHNEEELTTFVSRAISDRAWSRGVSASASAFVAQNQGATRRTVELLLSRNLTPANVAKRPAA